MFLLESWRIYEIKAKRYSLFFNVKAIIASQFSSLGTLGNFQ